MKNFLGKIKNFTKQITEVENNLYTGKKDFLEIYERNAELEREIEERTYELNVANQRMLTLQHIWDMMNSAKPISSVLKTTVKSLQTELNYLSCLILQKESDEQGEFSEIIAMSEDQTSQKMSALFMSPLDHTAISGMPCASAYFFTALKALCHWFAVTVFAVERSFKNLVVVPMLSSFCV